MRVAITHTRYPAHNGAESSIVHLVERLLDDGHEVHYYCQAPDEDRTDARVHLHKIPKPWKPIEFTKAWVFDRWLTQHVHRDEFDVVHGFWHSSYQDICSEGVADDDLDAEDEAPPKGPPGPRALRRRQVRAIEQRRFTRGNFHRIVTPTRSAAEQIRLRYGLTEEEVVTICAGVDIDLFHPSRREEHAAPLRERIVVPQDCFVILCAGDDYHRHGVPTLIEAARILRTRGGLPGDRSFRFAVVGKEQHSREKKLSELCKRKGVWTNVKFYGSQDRIVPWYAAADMLVHSSSSDAFGAPVLRALATGVPVAVAAKAGAAEVVRHGETGFLLSDPSDATVLADHILELASDEERRQRMGRAARASAESHSWDEHFARILDLYEEVAAAKRRLAGS